MSDDKSMLTNTYMYSITLSEELAPVLFIDDIKVQLNIPESCDPFIGINSF